jgi:ABC-type nitrate/sulfonate/bicarbonate transport system permease component
METSINSHAIPVLFAAIVITAVLSLALFGLVSVLEKLMLPWYHASRLPLHEALALGGRTGR